MPAAIIRADLDVVRLCVRSARRGPMRRSAVALSWMGNGLIYPLVALPMLAAGGTRSWAAITSGIINIMLLHCLYPILKKGVGRPRPYSADPELLPLLAPMDEHSFPSGHAMTLTGVLVPTVSAFPDALSSAIGLWAAMAWARIASAHHYPSDVLAGTGVGLLVAYPAGYYLSFMLARLLP